MPRLFPECPIFRDGIGRLCQRPEEEVVSAFAALCLGKEASWQQQGGEERGSAKELPGGGIMDTLRIMLDNVAFHPVRPEDMKVYTLHLQHTVCPRRGDPFDIVTYHIRSVTTS